MADLENVMHRLSVQTERLRTNTTDLPTGEQALMVESLGLNVRGAAQGRTRRPLHPQRARREALTAVDFVRQASFVAPRSAARCLRSPLVDASRPSVPVSPLTTGISLLASSLPSSTPN